MSLPDLATGPRPVARHTNASFVEVSPSTVIALNDRPAAFLVRRDKTFLETFASVATNASIVAMSGRIIPEPFAIPLTTASPVDSFTFRDAAFATVSVVMIASAADNQFAGLISATAWGTAAAIRSAGSASMITPVENGSTCSGLHFSSFATASQTFAARLRPSTPVPAFAFPVLTTSARTSPATLFFASTTGAAQHQQILAIGLLDPSPGNAEL